MQEAQHEPSVPDRKGRSMIASSYPLLDAFWTMLWFFGLFIWIWLLIMCFGDIFRSHDLSGFGKALWLLLIVVIPFFGVLVYLIARGGQMHERQAQQAEAQETAFRDYVRQAASSGTTGTSDELAKLAQLRDQGVISEAEFQQEKSKILAA